MAPGVDVAAETFISKVERLKLQTIQANVKPADLQAVADDVSRLPEFVHRNPELKPMVELCLSQKLASATPAQLTEIVKKLAPQMKFRKDNASAFLKLDLPDFIAASGYITLSEGGERLYVSQYRERVEKRINELAENHPTILAIQQGQSVTDLQLIALEKTLRETLSTSDVLLTTDNIRKAYGVKLNSFLGFLRFVLALDSLPDYGTVIQKCFDDHIQQHTYNANQLRFLRVMQAVLVKKRQISLPDLYEGDFATFGDDAVERMFTPPQISELMAFTQQLTA
jgi:type I restriction enzyme R subunit